MQYSVKLPTSHNASPDVIVRDFELIPQPQRIEFAPASGHGNATDGNATAGGTATVTLPYSGRIAQQTGDHDPSCVLANQIADDIAAATGLRWDVTKGGRWQSFVTLSIDETVLPQQAHAYRLTVGSDGIRVTGNDESGLRDGVQTLRQIIRQCAPVLPSLVIEDHPAYETRGYYLDATRGRVPTLDWLKTWADKLCLYKYNQLQLYVEHTFLFDGMSETWRGTSPLTPADIIAFDDYCAARGIELVPSVSTFGHLYMALRTRELRRLGEFPEQADRPYSLVERMEHHTLNITEPDSLALSFTLIDDYLDLFRTRKFNICGDETFDLGKGRSKSEADRRGVAAMYADYVSRLCGHLSEQGREPLFWGDIAIEMPEILTMLPDDVTLLNWLYAPNITDDKVRLVAQSGARQYVCPAVWCWNALLPRLDWAWNNISRLARYGMRYDAAGFLVTDWGDYGHVNDPRMAVTGMIYGAQCAWNPDAVQDIDEMNRRVSVAEYGDATGTFVALLREASRQVTFGWDRLVQYLELDMGDGSLNRDVRDAIWTGDDADARAHIRASETVAEARERLLAWLGDDLARTPAANRELDRTVAGLGAVAAGMTSAGARGAASGSLAPILVGAEGQRLLNLFGWCMAVRGGVIDADNGAGDMPGAAAAGGTVDGDMVVGDANDGTSDDEFARYERSVARDLERWFETYATVWRTVSAESELRRIADVIWRCADLLRA
ncbi:beta-N-acetylhexosaminidase [Bifidobacterium aerophilum]|uniref:beta-N-acetylhexosaminidase n=1 Tax=Bifidobacterium aerophilum TaxID=1798155 RepID=UPI00308460B3